MKHAPGPYDILYDEYGPYAIVGPDQPDGSRLVIADIESCDTAHAVLLALAPELLETLENLLDMVTDMRTHGPEVEAAADVIYKVRGE